MILTLAVTVAVLYAVGVWLLLQRSLSRIVIGLAVTALMLTYAVQLHRRRGSLLIDDYKELKW